MSVSLRWEGSLPASVCWLQCAPRIVATAQAPAQRRGLGVPACPEAPDAKLWKMVSLCSFPPRLSFSYLALPFQ